MRLVREDRINLMMSRIGDMMCKPSFQPFLYKSPFNTRVLSGEEEGVFALITVNYLRGVFSNESSKQTS